MAILFQQLVNEALREGQTEKEITSWHASRMGSCLRGMFLERKGVKPDKDFDERTLRVFQCGKVFEDFLVSLAEKKMDIEKQVRVESKELNISGYADLVVKHEGEIKVYEIKSKHSAGFTYLPNDQHRQQLWIYLYCLNISSGNLVYLSKDDLRIAEYPVLLDDEKLKQTVLGQINVLNIAWRDDDITKLPLIDDPKDWRGRFCRWHISCYKG